MKDVIIPAADASGLQIPDDVTAAKDLPKTFEVDEGDDDAIDLTLIPLRDYFAGQALAGYLAAHADPDAEIPHKAKVAATAFRFADAMLAERRKGVR